MLGINEENLSVEEVFNKLLSMQLDEQIQPGSGMDSSDKGNHDNSSNNNNTSVNNQAYEQEENTNEQEEHTDDIVTEEMLQELEADRALRDFLNSIGRSLLSNHGEYKYFELPDQNLEKIKRIRNILRAIYGHDGYSKYTILPRPKRKQLDSNIKLLATSRKTFGKVAVLVDVSGSLESYREKVWDELIQVVYAARYVDVFFGDTDLLDVKKRIQNPKKLQGMISGWGTDMATLMEQIDNNDNYVSIIVITDTITPWPNSPLSKPTYCIPVGDYQQDIKNVPNWIKVIW